MPQRSTDEHSRVAALKKLEQARARLMLDRPFIGALVVHLPLEASTRCRSVATDARAIYFNPAFVLGLSLAESQFVLAHEALHSALNHFTRRGTRLAERWNRACDFAVDQLLADDGFTLVPGAHADPRFRGLSAEEIYPLLDEHVAVADGFDEHWFGAYALGQRSMSKRLVDSKRSSDNDEFLAQHQDGFDELGARGVMAQSELAAEWEGRLASSAHAAQEAGRLNPHWRAVLPAISGPRLPWRALLARFLAHRARDDYSYARPSRRVGEALLPGLASTQITLVVALDTSGSIEVADFRAFVDELDALKGQLAARVALIACDAKIAAGMPMWFEPWEPASLPPELEGGGMTSFTPVFEWVARQGFQPDALVYFTDALGEFPANAPNYPVMWLVKGNGVVPWGERVQLN